MFVVVLSTSKWTLESEAQGDGDKDGLIVVRSLQKTIKWEASLLDVSAR